MKCWHFSYIPGCVLTQCFGGARPHPALRATLSRRERVVFSLLLPGEGAGMRALCLPGARASRPLRGFFAGGTPALRMRLSPSGRKAEDEGNRMNEVIAMCKRSSFRPSPDKGRTGGVCGGEMGFLPDLLPQTPLDPPLSGGKRVDGRFLSHPMVSCAGFLPQGPGRGWARLDRGQSNQKRFGSQQFGESAVNYLQGMEEE
jgi:hypothetical protein